MQDIESLIKSALEDVKKATNKDAIQSLNKDYLGRVGKLTEFLKNLKNLPSKDRATVGKKANDFRRELESLIKSKLADFEKTDQNSKFRKEQVDITMPGKKMPIGHLHPLTKIRKEVEAVFVSMGFEVVEGPEVDTEHYNFDALNIPENHPARDMWDTFWLTSKDKKSKSKNLLRTHTSPVQIHYMEHNQPPFRIIAPGKVFRYEATDASHDIEFYQVEGLLVSKDASVANFKYLITKFFRAVFGKKVDIRLRPSFFPFVEPGFEVDMSCIQCGGKGCSVCSRTGWLEMMGAGMVHPNVFKAVGYNPKMWQGIAFGVGLDRIAMMKYKIPDIRFFHQNDIRFLRQF